VIELITAALAGHIESRTPDLGSWVDVHSMSAADPAPVANHLVLALLAVDAHEHLRNSPPVSTGDGYQRAPLHLRLSYLITHVGPHDEAQARLARVLAIFHTTPILRTSDLPADVAAHVSTLTVRLCNTTADERSYIWSALGRQARLALYYTVDVALIDLLDGPDGWGIVTKHRVDYVGPP
jgi:hypothetical protein